MFERPPQTPPQKSPFDVLGIAPSAAEEEIEAVFRNKLLESSGDPEATSRLWAARKSIREQQRQTDVSHTTKETAEEAEPQKESHKDLVREAWFSIPRSRREELGITDEQHAEAYKLMQDPEKHSKTFEAYWSERSGDSTLSKEEARFWYQQQPMQQQEKVHPSADQVLRALDQGVVLPEPMQLHLIKQYANSSKETFKNFWSRHGGRFSVEEEAARLAYEKDKDPRSYYEVLGVPTTASRDHIEHAFRARLKELASSADENSQYETERLWKARDTLLSHIKRRRYDSKVMHLSEGEMNASSYFPPGYFNNPSVDFEDHWERGGDREYYNDDPLWKEYGRASWNKDPEAQAEAMRKIQERDGRDVFEMEIRPDGSISITRKPEQKLHREKERLAELIAQFESPQAQEAIQDMQDRIRRRLRSIWEPRSADFHSRTDTRHLQETTSVSYRDVLPETDDAASTNVPSTTSQARSAEDVFIIPPPMRRPFETRKNPRTGLYELYQPETGRRVSPYGYDSPPHKDEEGNWVGTRRGMDYIISPTEGITLRRRFVSHPEVRGGARTDVSRVPLYETASHTAPTALPSEASPRIGPHGRPYDRYDFSREIGVPPKEHLVIKPEKQIFNFTVGELEPTRLKYVLNDKGEPISRGYVTLKQVGGLILAEEEVPTEIDATTVSYMLDPVTGKELRSLSVKIDHGLIIERAVEGDRVLNPRTGKEAIGSYFNILFEGDRIIGQGKSSDIAFREDITDRAQALMISNPSTVKRI